MRSSGMSIAGALMLALVAQNASSQELRVWPGVAPGSEGWTHKERTFADTPVGTVIINVVTPTLTAYLPEKSRATGSAVIVAPGGAFVALAMDKGGTDVARWFREQGVAAFLLKYRLLEKREEGIPGSMDMDAAGQYGIADGIQALKVIRQHAAEYGIAADRIGFIGFSAGAMVASGALLNPDAAARPSFAVLMYGAPFGTMPEIPKQLPPIFMAWSQDDPMTLSYQVRFHRALEAAGHKPEVHIYSAGGHGFGIQKQGTTSDHWMDELYYWMEAQSLVKRR